MISFMNQSNEQRFEIPEGLRQQLLAFRRRLWLFKILEAIAIAVIGILVGFLMTYSFDRFTDTPNWVRISILLGSILTSLSIPIAVERWILRRRHFEQLARLLCATQPNVGDQLLGVLHLSSDGNEQARSPELVLAAIRQVAGQLSEFDFTNSIPNPRHGRRGKFVALFALLGGLLFGVSSEAAWNSWSRFVRPWRDTPRFTFAQVDSFPSSLVVAHGEPFDLSVELKSVSRWKPAVANLELAGSVVIDTPRDQNRYQFSLPGQVDPISIDLSVGDYRGSMRLKPTHRPELKRLSAHVELPAYLGRQGVNPFEIRGGTVSLVIGSQVSFHAQTSRELEKVWFNGSAIEPSDSGFITPVVTVEENQEVPVEWSDGYGLSAKDQLLLRIEAQPDELPSLVCENLPRRKVLLTSEVLTFQIRAHDDFGVKHVGLNWSEVSDGEIGNTLGETLIGGGGVEVESLQLTATFCSEEHGIEEPMVAVRAFVEDYYPGAHRQYSPASYFQLLDPSEHAIWLTSELTRWHRMSLDVRDRELQLHQRNRELRELPLDDLTGVEGRAALSKQADQEQANGRQLSNLVRSGEGLLREAMRNDEVGADYLEEWAEMVQVLKEISEERMPSVADLLKKASTKTSPGGEKAAAKSPKVGQNRLTQNPEKSGETQDDQNGDQDKPPTPSVSDIESTQLNLDNLPKQESNQPKSQQGRLGFADTKLAGNGQSESKPSQPETELDQAVIEQEGLLEEFDKVAGEMNEILANLEGSTLVKRLKAASRGQQKVAAGLAGLVTNAFGVPDREKHADGDAFLKLSEIELQASQDVSDLMDDMTAYFERSRLQLLQRVLEQMKQQDVTAGLRDLGNELRQENGLSISQAEFWSDNLDRWAEDLVEVTQSGASPGGKPKGSMPPSIVLEVLQLLDDEVKLRERTRVAEQSRPVITDTEHMEAANRLGDLQQGYQARVDALVDQILELPNAEGDFANELNMLGQVSAVMEETTEILFKPQTGPVAIAAETEIIELLLKSKRFNPNASGGSGADPGGGGKGKTEVAALALVGSGVNPQEVKEETNAIQANQVAQPGLPEEFRSGLDQYFNRLEEWKAK